jgi:hypothetical protein
VNTKESPPSRLTDAVMHLDREGGTRLMDTITLVEPLNKVYTLAPNKKPPGGEKIKWCK